MEIEMDMDKSQGASALSRYVAACDIAVPEALVAEAYGVLVAEAKHRVLYESMASGEGIEALFLGMQDQVESLRAEAFQTVKTRLVLQRYIHEMHLSVTREELEDEAAAIAERQGMSLQTVRDVLGAELAALEEELLMEKAIRQIENSNTQ